MKIKKKYYKILNGLDVKQYLGFDYCSNGSKTSNYHELINIKLTIDKMNQPFLDDHELSIDLSEDTCISFYRIMIWKVYRKDLYFIGFYKYRKHYPTLKFVIDETIFKYIKREITLDDINNF